MNQTDAFRDYLSNLSDVQITLLIDEAEREIRRRDQKYRDQKSKRDAWYARPSTTTRPQGPT